MSLKIFEHELQFFIRIKENLITQNISCKANFKNVYFLYQPNTLEIAILCLF